MSGIRPIIDAAVAQVLSEHPKLFTERGHERARDVLVRKIMAAIRGDGVEKVAEPAAAVVPASVPLSVEPESREGRAYTNLCEVSGAVRPFRASDGRITIPPAAACPAVYAFADLPPKDTWLFICDRQQMGAWHEFFREALPMAARRPIAFPRDGHTGILMPWPWPPTKTGATSGTGPRAENAA